MLCVIALQCVAGYIAPMPMQRHVALTSPRTGAVTMIVRRCSPAAGAEAFAACHRGRGRVLRPRSSR